MSISLLLFSCGGGGGGNGSDATCVAPLKVSTDALMPLQGTGTTWTVLVYLAADNNLSQAALTDLAEMEAVGSTASVKVVVQLDTFGGSTQRLLVGQGSSTLLEDLGEQNMADPAILTDFITWGSQNYPADRTVLILWSHGLGHQKPDLDVGAIRELPLQRTPYSILQDDTDGVGCCLSNIDVRQAIEDTGEHFDLLGFDASQMGQIETAYEFRNVTDLLVFSQETGQANGWEYTGILQGLTDQPDMDAQQLAGLIVRTYEDFYEDIFYPANPGFEQTLTISAIQLGTTAEDVAGAIDGLSLALMDVLGNPDIVDAITEARNKVQGLTPFITPHIYVDLFELADEFLAQTALDSATVGALEALECLRDTIVTAEYHGQARPDATGLSIVFFKLPEALNFNTYDSDYVTGQGGLAFINDTAWDDFLSAYYTSAGLL